MNVRPWGPVEALLRAADGADDELAAAVSTIGLDVCLDVLLDELLLRWPGGAAQEPARLQLEVAFGGRTVRRVLVAERDAVRVEEAAGGPALARIGFPVTELVRALFATAPGRSWTPRVRINWPDGAMAAYRVLSPVTGAVDALLAACSSAPVPLGPLSVRYGSDKWGSLHWYTQHYDRHFAELRDRPVRLLEIGIGGYQDPRGGGGSLRMWQRYFRRGLVYGLDIFPKPGVEGPRIRTVRGDQGDAAFLERLGKELGPFDIVIDDGSHLNEHVLTSFEALFPFVRHGGIYVVEDLQTSYWPGYGGNAEDLNAPRTSVGRLKGLIDGLHYQEFDRAAGPSYTDTHVSGVHFYHNVVFIDKGVNAEEGIPSWVGRSPRW